MKSRKISTLEGIFRFLTSNVNLTTHSIKVSEKCMGQKELEGFEIHQPVFRIEVRLKSLLNDKVVCVFDWAMGSEIRITLPPGVIRK